MYCLTNDRFMHRKRESNYCYESKRDFISHALKTRNVMQNLEMFRNLQQT